MIADYHQIILVLKHLEMFQTLCTLYKTDIVWRYSYVMRYQVSIRLLFITMLGSW